jgi:hypothetical protein
MAKKESAFDRVKTAYNKVDKRGGEMMDKVEKAGVMGPIMGTMGSGATSKMASKIGTRIGGEVSEVNLAKRAKWNERAPINKERLKVERYNKETQDIKKITKNRNKSDPDYQGHIKESKAKDLKRTKLNKTVKAFTHKKSYAKDKVEYATDE